MKRVSLGARSPCTSVFELTPIVIAVRLCGRQAVDCEPACPLTGPAVAASAIRAPHAGAPTAVPKQEAVEPSSPTRSASPEVRLAITVDDLPGGGSDLLSLSYTHIQMLKDIRSRRARTYWGWPYAAAPCRSDAEQHVRVNSAVVDVHDYAQNGICTQVKYKRCRELYAHDQAHQVPNVLELVELSGAEADAEVHLRCDDDRDVGLAVPALDVSPRLSFGDSCGARDLHGCAHVKQPQGQLETPFLDCLRWPRNFKRSRNRSGLSGHSDELVTNRQQREDT
mgnify:FL=1